jgi:diguanylate cyclase (GGDEF)-like protein/PAS domain S-box-containing protein
MHSILKAINLNSIRQKLDLNMATYRLLLLVVVIIFSIELLIMAVLPLIIKSNVGLLAADLLNSSLLSIFTAIAILPLLISYRNCANNTEMALQITDEGYWQVSRDGRIAEVNRGYCEMVGYTREQIIGKHFSAFAVNKSAEEVQAKIEQIMANGQDRFECCHRHSNGALVYVEISVSYMAKTGQFICFLRNITDKKLAENELKIAAAAFETQESIMVCNVEQVILRVNQAFTRMTGYHAQEVIGKTSTQLRSTKHNEAFYDAIWDTVSETGIWAGEIYSKRKNGEDFPAYLGITAVKNTSGVITHYVTNLTDIANTKKAAEEIERLAFYDPLTSLPNRRLLLDRLAHALAAQARTGKLGALLFLDLDNFKQVNDTRGHYFGDLLLQQVADRLTASLRESDTVGRVARLGGDEFVVVLENLSDSTLKAASQTETVGKKILAVLNDSFQLGSHHHYCTTSIGVVLFSDQTKSVDELLKQADIAMYQAKKAGRNTMRFFDPNMQVAINTRVDLEAELYKAIEHNQFQLHYQIQVDSLARPFGAEVLIRWLHPERGLVPPLDFIPLAEETGLIFPIGQWVLETACAQLKNWQNNPLTRELTLSVNVSAKQFHHPDFVAQVKSAIRKQTINPTKLKLELTESMLLENVEDTIEKMNALKEIGVLFSLDDFGTGYSSLQYLKRLPLYQLKIDRSFVKDIASDDGDKAIVRTIISMAQSLNMEVIAEGVETEEQRQILMEKKCTSYQGYLFGKPVAIDQFEQQLNQVNLAALERN